MPCHYRVANLIVSDNLFVFAFEHGQVSNNGYKNDCYTRHLYSFQRLDDFTQKRYLVLEFYFVFRLIL